MLDSQVKKRPVKAQENRKQHQQHRLRNTRLFTLSYLSKQEIQLRNFRLSLFWLRLSLSWVQSKLNAGLLKTNFKKNLRFR